MIDIPAMAGSIFVYIFIYSERNRNIGDLRAVSNGEIKCASRNQ